MTRKKSNVKALALAVTCAILAGGGIGLEPVYAADALYKEASGNVTTATKNGETDNTIINELTVGGVKIGSEDSFTGISIGSNSTSNHVIISDNDILASGAVHASVISSGLDARMEGGKLVAKNGLYIGATDITNPTNENSKFYVSGESGNVVSKGIVYAKGLNVAAGKFSVDDGTGNVTTTGALKGKTLGIGGTANDRFTVDENGKTVVTGGKGTVTIDPAGEGIVYERKEANQRIQLDSGYVKASGYVEAPKFSIDGDNFFMRNEQGSQLLVSDSKGRVNIGDGTITATSDVNVGGTLCTNKILNATPGEGVTVDGVKFKAGAVSGISDINDGIIKFSKNGTKDIVQINSDLMFNDDAGQQAATLTLEGVKTLNGLSNGSSQIKAGNGSVVGGVTFDQGKVTNVVSINDNLKFESDGIYLNKGDQAKQIKIGTDGKIIIGTSSSAYDTNGFYAGGDDYTEAKAAIDGINGKIKGANGAFGVDDNGNVTTTGDIKGKDITASGKLTVDSDATVGGNLGVTGDTTLKGKLDVTGDTTVGGNLHANKNAFVKGMLTVDGNIEGKGALKGKTLGIGSTGNEFTVDANGNTAVGGTLGVTGKTTLSDELQVDKTATFGTAVGSQTVIKGDQVATGRIETDATQASKIGGVTLQNGKVTATDMTVTGTIDFKNLKVNDTLTVGTNTKITEGTLQLGTAEDNKLTAEKLANINQTIKANRVIDATSATIGGVEINGGNVTATGTVQGKTIYDGVGAKLENGKITAKEGQIGNVTISAAGEVTGVKSIEASTFKVDEDNYLNGNGITAKEGKIGAVSIEGNTLNIGSTTLDKAEGITTNKLKIAGMTLTGTSLDTGTADFQVNGVTFNQGKVTAQADKGFVAGTSSFKEGSLIVDANNKLEATSGLTTKKATVKGNLDVTGKATFGTAGSQTTIEGDAITTDTLKANKLILGASGDTTVEVDKDGSLIAAKGKFKVDKDGALKAADGAFTVAKDGKTTFTKDADNLSSINGGNIWAKATDIADNTSSELTHDYKGLHIKGNKSGQKSAFDFDTASGIGTFTGQDNSTTKINGSAIRSEKIDGTAGKLDGENLTLYKDPNNQTTMSAGKATFTGDAGEKGGKVTTINGGTISTDTLNVERINLGEDILDSNGNPHGSNLSMDKQGNFSAAGGNFKVTGGTTGSRGSITNIVGDDTTGKTAFETNQQGANMSFEKGSVKSEVSVADDSAKISAGASSIEVKDGSITNNGVTTFNGTTGTTTKIDGGTITTNHLITDKLTITGSGNADGTGSGSIAFGGNGSITSNIKDATTGKEATFKTDEKGTFTEAKDNDGNKTTNTVNAKGNTNVVTNSTNTSTATQTATSIGGVVTNGTVTMRQELTADGVKVSVDGDTANYTQITNKDVSITDQKNPGKRINLSDLGQLNDLDGELTARDEYTNNKTAVGAINAEAAIRREEVARLDGRINDVNDRVNKVGAMAAAIASLKSIGYDPQAPSEFSIGLGQYKGETGVAMGFFHYPNKNFMINVSLSTAGGETMGGIGATWRFGHKSPQKLLEEQREAQAKKELAAAEKYQAAAKLAKEAQERAEYAAKLARQAQVSADNAKAAADATQAKHFG